MEIHVRFQWILNIHHDDSWNQQNFIRVDGIELLHCHLKTKENRSSLEHWRFYEKGWRQLLHNKIFSGFAIGSLCSWCTSGSIKRKQYEMHPLVAIDFGILLEFAGGRVWKLCHLLVPPGHLFLPIDWQRWSGSPFDSQILTHRESTFFDQIQKWMDYSVYVTQQVCMLI